MNELALFTAVYPGVERFLADWYRSVLAQTDQDFDLVIGVDGLDLPAVIDALKQEPRVTWIPAPPSASPAQMRQAAFELLVMDYQAVIFVDSDDLLLPHRVAAARRALETYDVVASAMTLIDESGSELGFTFNMPVRDDPGAWLLRGNVFGLSNTAYRSSALKCCMPIPAQCSLVDWYMATRAWLAGAHLGFDPSVQMAYRQHGRNIASTLRPFTPEKILASARYVHSHYALVLETLDPEDPRRADFEKMHLRVAEFYEAINSRTEVLNDYTAAINRMPSQPVWWTCVANPELEDIWKS